MSTIKIIGNTTATPVPRSDWAQTDESKVDYILNKPELSALATKDTVEKDDLAADVQASLMKADTAVQSLDGYATEQQLENAISNHSHNDAYYTKNDVDAELANKADSDHNHNESYDAKGSASAVQENLNIVSDELDAHTSDANIHVTTTNKSNWNTAYTHSQSAHARTDATKVADSTTNGNILIDGTETNVYSHPNSGVTAGTYKSVTVDAQGHITAGTNPTTLAGYGITDAESKGAASSALASAKEYTDTVANGKSDKTHNHDNAYDAKGSASSALASAKTYADSAASSAANAVKNDLLNGASAAYDTLKELGDLIVDNADAIDALEVVAAGKADKTHGHAIADVSGLQSALDGKAAASHGTHVSYSTTAPVMDGTASAGSAGTVARSDHKHPTDTSRAAKTDLDSHTGNTTVHITSTERSNWNAAKSHADSAHAPSNAEKNQNAFSNITVGSTTVAADTATDTVTFVGSNVTITPDATNDKITFAVADGSTSAKGIVQLTNSTSSTSTTTAATPSSVKSAYDRASTAITNASTAQTKADSAYSLAEGKANSSHTHDDRYYTESEVDSKISTLNTAIGGKAASSHTHDDRYYTESEIDSKVSTLNTAINGKAASSHTHDDRYYTESEVNTKLATKLNKLSYEWVKEYNAGGTAGYLLIGSFPMYDSNLTINIDSTTSTTYHGTLVIATQNVSETSIGSAHTITVYDDPTGTISDAIRIVKNSGSRNYNVYFVPATWSKTFIHVRALGQYLDAFDESTMMTFTTGTAPTTTSGLTVTNALKAQLDTKASSSHTHTPSAIGAAAASHTHDDRYYTETEIDTKVSTLNSAISGKADSSHTHDDRYYTETEINTKVDALNTAISGKAASSHNQASNTINAMTGYSKASAASAITTSDTLNSAIGKLEKALDGKQASGSYAASSHTHDDKYYTEAEIDSKVSTLNTAINGKAPTSHASTATTYGAGTSSNYGHVKLSDATNSTSGASAGIAASPAAVKSAYDKANHSHPYLSDATKYAASSSAGGSASTVAVTDTTPSSGTMYYPLFATGKSGGQTVRANSDLYYYHGGSYAYLNVGDSNTQGGISFHQSNGYYINLAADSGLTSNPTCTLPKAGGTIYTTGNLSSATTSAAGLMSAADKTKLDGLSDAPAYSYGTEDLTAGTSPLATGALYFVYE